MLNAQNCWHINIHEQDKTSERLKVRKIFIFQYLSFYEQLKFHARLSFV